MQENYQIRVKGHLGAAWSTWFAGLRISNEPNGEAVLTGPLPDQAALHGVLNRVRDLGLVLLAVQRVAPDIQTRIKRERKQRNGGNSDDKM